MSVTVLTKPEIIQTAGRSKELALLRRTLEELRGGTGGCVMIEGPGGIGKSHLLEAAASEAAQQDIRIIAAGAAGARLHSTRVDSTSPHTSRHGSPPTPAGPGRWTRRKRACGNSP